MNRLAQITGITPQSTVFLNWDPDFIGRLIGRFLTFAIAGAGFVFLAQVIMAGYKYMTSLGEPASIQSATKQLLHALTGLLVVITTFFLIQIIETVFGLDIL